MFKQNLLVTFLALAVSPVSLAAAAGVATEAGLDMVSVDILQGWQTEDGQHMAALRLRLAPQWKTYWRAPGDAGIPPVFDWTGSQNLGDIKMHWPRPEVFISNGMRSIGYHDELILPIEVTAITADQPVMLNATIDLGVCRDICMPASLTVTADLSATGTSSLHDPIIVAALQSQPTQGVNAGLTAISCQIDPISDGLRVIARVGLPAVSTTETVVMEAGQGGIWVSEASVTRDGDQLVATVDMVAETGLPFVLDRADVTVTVLGTDRAVEINGCPAA